MARPMSGTRTWARTAPTTWAPPRRAVPVGPTAALPARRTTPVLAEPTAGHTTPVLARCTTPVPAEFTAGPQRATTTRQATAAGLPLAASIMGTFAEPPCVS